MITSIEDCFDPQEKSLDKYDLDWAISEYADVESAFD